MLALARLLGVPFETKQLMYNGLHWLGPNHLGPSLASLSTDSRKSLLAEPAPALTISVGQRSVPVVRALRQRAGGGMSSIHIGFPRVSPSVFDLVVATPQYPVQEHANLLRIPYALTTAAFRQASAKEEPELAMLPSPRELLLVGGPTLHWDLDGEALLAALSSMLANAQEKGGSVLVTTSPRTPNEVRARLQALLDVSRVPTLLALPKQTPSLASLLAAADSVRVTADSVAMISDAIWSGKPLGVVPVRNTPLGNAAIAIADWLRPGKRNYPRDLRFFWRALDEIRIGTEPSLPRTTPDAVREAILNRIRPILHAAGLDRRTVLTR